MADTEIISPASEENSRVDLEKKAFKYFARTNYANKSILLQEKIFKKHLEDQWESLPQERKDDLLDLLFVNEEVRKTSSSVTNNSSSRDVQLEEECFPRCLVNMGQKINVDFENELWTWKDEHSGPFSWMSKSQQDLTLADLEEETLMKPQPRQPRIDLEDEAAAEQRRAAPQFTYPCSSWSLDVLNDFYRHQDSIVLKPSPSLDFESSMKETSSVKTSRSAEELNPAFIGSSDDLSPRNNTGEDVSEDLSKQNGCDENIYGDITSRKKEKDRKSPSPKRVMINGNSFKRSPIKKSEKGREEKLLVGDHKEPLFSEAYSNPAMESEWSTFVGGEQKPSLPIMHQAPPEQTMDRGAACSSVPSPYRGDQVRLISQDEGSPALARVTSGVKSVTLEPSKNSDPAGWSSAESTPDHNTHLLKGLQSAPSLSAPQPLSSDELTSGQSEQMLTVDVDTSQVTLHSAAGDTENLSSSIPNTGFDFLDNW